MESISFEKPRSMVMQIYRDIAHAISHGILKPGELLRERDLQEWFGVSRAPIREAIRLLEGDGLVVVNSYKKKYVRPITYQDFKDIAMLLACLEGFAANLATDLITNEQVDNIEKINEELKNAFEQNNSDLCANLNLKFHESYVKIINNKHLNKAIRPLTKTIVWFWLTHLYFKHSNLIPLSIDEHKKIIKAFRSRDASKTEEETRKHVINSTERILKFPIFDSNGNYVLPSSR